MITWLGALIWSLCSFFFGFWGVPILSITLLGCLAGYVWKDIAIEIGKDTGILKSQVAHFSKLSLSSIQVLPAEAKINVAYALFFFVIVAFVSILFLALACYAFKIHKKTPRTWQGLAVSTIVGFVVGFIFVGTCGLSLTSLGFEIPTADYSVLQYFFSVLISALA